MKKAVSFPIGNFTEIKIKMLNWANRFNIFCLLDNHQYQFEKPAFECLLAVGCKEKLTVNAGNGAFDQLKIFSHQHKGWLFGHLGYDLKNELENLQSLNLDSVGFDDLCFFVPEIVVELSNNTLFIYADEAEANIFDDIIASSPIVTSTGATVPFSVQHKMSEQTYISNTQQLQLHMLQGDCYEVNYCQEFFAEKALVDPLKIYLQLSALSPSPFAALYKLNDKFCISASPERYLKKTGSTILSQPIKGTAIRDINNKQLDELSKLQLLNSEKEKSENVMVVDLVRNDLSKICKEGTVKVDELFGLYSFPQVHQMISSISGELRDELDWVDAIKATFPMGSMTGAPKKKVMELIEQYEQTKRGLYSGAIGYVHPNGNFDFNVVIRSILYNASAQYVSFQTGSAITYYSNPIQEYEECLLKASAIRKVLQG